MGQDSSIEWTDHTMNFGIGCTKVSDGCKHCYAESMMDHHYRKAKWGPSGTRNATSASNWRKPFSWNKEAERRGERKKVFCMSLGDFFEDRDDLRQMRRDAFDVIVNTHWLDWQILTKRPENALQMMTDAGLYATANPSLPCPQPNIWLGTSIENQATADERIPHLLKVPAAVRFLSCEPLLGPVDISQSARWHFSDCTCLDCIDLRDVGKEQAGIDWVIVGCESGRGARRMSEDWVRSLRNQCALAGAPFFYKQKMVDGCKVGLPELDGRQHAEFPKGGK